MLKTTGESYFVSGYCGQYREKFDPPFRYGMHFFDFIRCCAFNALSGNESKVRNMNLVVLRWILLPLVSSCIIFIV